MLSLQNLAAERDERILFSGLSLDLAQGECLYVVGANGTGKTTLLRILCGLTLPSAGQIEWQGQSIQRFRENYCRDLLYLGHRNANKAELSSYENLRLGLGIDGVKVTDEALADALADAGILRLAHLPARFLSQGQQRRLAMARLKLSSARIWVLDEPYTALDVKAIIWLDQKISHHLSQGGLVILTSHQALNLNVTVRQVNLEAYHA